MNDFRLNWQQPLPQLGPALRPEPPMTPAQRLRDERAEFEIQDYEAVVKDDVGYIVTEDDCRQVHEEPLSSHQLIGYYACLNNTTTITLSAPTDASPVSWVCHEIRGIESGPVAPSAPQGEWRHLLGVIWQHKTSPNIQRRYDADGREQHRWIGKEWEDSSISWSLANGLDADSDYERLP